MRLYLITILPSAQSPTYGVYDAHVVASWSPDEVRRIANARPGDEGEVWTDARYAKVEQIGFYTGRRRKSHIVLSSFNAG